MLNSKLELGVAPPELSLMVCLLAVGLLATGCPSQPSSDTRTSSGAEAERSLPASAAGGEASKEQLIEILRESDPFVRIRQLADVLPRLNPEGHEEVRKILISRALDLSGADVTLLLQTWGARDPEAATYWALEKSPLAFRVLAIRTMVQTLAEEDPQAALQAVESLGPPGPNVTLARFALVQGWLESGQPGLDDYLQSFSQGLERQQLFSILTRNLIYRNGAAAAKKWAESLPNEPPRFKLGAFRRLASELAKVDIAEATAWCDKHCEGPFGDNVRERVAIEWGRVDGPATMAWLSKAPAGKGRDQAVREGYRNWWKTDPEGVEEWVRAVGIEGVEPWFQPAVGMWAMPLSWENPEEAMKWVALVPGDEQRELAMVTVARRWRDQDEDAAEAWLAQSTLSEEARQKSREYPPNWRRFERSKVPLKVY